MNIEKVWPALLAAGVRWRHGMLGAGHCDRVIDDGVVATWDNEVCEMDPGFPDLNDPATVGCLLAELRRVSGCPHLSAVWNSDVQAWGIWFDYADDSDPWVGLGRVSAPTEGEAILAALCAVLGVPCE